MPTSSVTRKPTIVHRYIVYILAGINGVGASILFTLLGNSDYAANEVMGYGWLALYLASPFFLGYFHPRNILKLIVVLISGATVGMIFASLFLLPPSSPGAMDNPIGSAIAVPMILWVCTLTMVPSVIQIIIGSWLAKKRGY